MRRLICTVFVCAALLVQARGQETVQGVVRDAVSLEPLVGATVQIEVTGQGTVTDREGAFVLERPGRSVVLRVRFIGYVTSRLTLEAEEPDPLDIRLQPDTLVMDEVLVTGEDPAINIMRRVIARKQEWLQTLESYRAEAYTRFMLYRRRELVEMREAVVEAYWKPDGGTREVVQARRLHPNRGETFRFAGPIAVPNFYDDRVELDGFSFIGPTHPAALDAYTFRFGEQQMLDGNRVYEIYCTPRSPTALALVGRLAVLVDEYVLLEAELRPSTAAVPVPPVLARRNRYIERFAPTSEGFWFPTEFRMEGRVRFGRTGVHYPEASYTQVSRLTTHVPNWPPPDSLYRGETARAFALFVDRQDYFFDGHPALIPLTDEERIAVAALNPRLSLRGAFYPSGLLQQFGGVRVAESLPSTETEDRPIWRRSLTLRPRLWYNRVDGVHLGLGTILTRGLFDVELEGGMAWERRTFQYRTALGVHVPVGRWLEVESRVEVGRQTLPTFASAAYSRFLNSIPTYLGYDDYFDYYDNTWTRFVFGLRVPAVGARLSAYLDRERHERIDSVISFPGWLVGEGQRENPGIEEGRLRSVTIRAQMGEVPQTALVPGANGVLLEVEHSLDEGDFAFTRYRAEARGSWPTFYRGRTWPNRLSVRATAGTSSGALPRQRWGVLDGSRLGFNPFGAFKTRRGLPYTGTRYAALFWEHDFTTVVFEALRLWPLADLSLGITLHGAHGRTWNDIEPSSAGTHHEIGLSLTRFLRFPIRLDFTRRLDAPGFTVGLGVVRRF